MLVNLMDKIFLVAIYLIGLIFAEVLRIPQRLRRYQDHQTRKKADHPSRFSELIVLSSILLGIWILPIIYSVTSWLSVFDYMLPSWTIWIAIVLFLTSMVIRLIAQLTLSRPWSFTLETSENHRFIQNGIYSLIRHPIYVSLIFWAIAQPVLLQNYLAGLSGPAAVLLIWVIRVPREEALMIGAFGDEYRSYMEKTGRVF